MLNGRQRELRSEAASPASVAMGLRRVCLHIAIVLTGLMVWGAACAQVASTSGNEIQEIIVTAQRRSESLERVPVTMSALSGADLTKQHIDTESSLQIAVPGLIVRAGRSSDVLNYSIRGETVDPISDMRPGVL